MGFPEDYPNIDFFTNEFVDGVVGIKKALVDGRFEVSEVTTVIRALDSALADYMEKVLVGLKGLYPEVKELAAGGPFKMLIEGGPYFAGVFMRIFE